MRYYKHLWQAKLVIKWLWVYDWCCLKLQGEKIISQSYLVLGDISMGNRGYCAFRQIITQSLIDDLHNMKPWNPEELEKQFTSGII